MTITFTEKEIEVFSQNMQQWNIDCLNFILKHCKPTDFPDRPPDQLIALRERFEKENPRPNWRNLL